jgi:hypothetical protein
MKICLRGARDRQRPTAIFSPSASSADTIVAAAIGGGATFVGTHVLEHCQKYPRGGCHD